MKYADELEVDDFLQTYSRDKLIRSEFSTLTGLLIRTPIQIMLPSPDVTQELIDRTDRLMLELHHSLLTSFEVAVAGLEPGSDPAQLFASGAVLREAVFYSGESAYNFQYRELAKRKYAKDDPWLLQNRGFSIEQAVKVATAIAGLQLERLTAFQVSFAKINPNDWTFLPAFAFTAEDVASRIGEDVASLEKILRSFTVPEDEHNEGFKKLNDFNVINASPILQVGAGRLLPFSVYGLLEAIYESPFYWMYKDNAYRNTAQKNRGHFTEEFAAECFDRVFERKHVLRNVIITDRAGSILGEIDVLVAFGNRALILQAKSKRMTLEARRGNDGVIRDDFAKSVQDAYDQAYSCACLLGNPDLVFTSLDGKLFSPPRFLKVYLICALADHYPALSFQSSHFLNKRPSSEVISAPFVLDVFTLDVLTEMLASPLRLLSYIDRRTSYDDKVAAGHELTILSYHLKNNLWMSAKFDRLFLSDDISADLDLSMTVRRDGVPGLRTPDGILTAAQGSSYDSVLKKIENYPRPELLSLGMMLLKMSGDAVGQLNQGVTRMLALSRSDLQPHNFMMGSGETGLVIHTSFLPREEARRDLVEHVKLRKYRMRAPEWFGMFLDPRTGALAFGYNSKHPWVSDSAMDDATKSLTVDVSRR